VIYVVIVMSYALKHLPSRNQSGYHRTITGTPCCHPSQSLPRETSILEMVTAVLYFSCLSFD